MKNNVKVSVIIAVYNAEKYLVQCLDSVLNQTLKEIEIILVNDGSTDNSMQILEKYQKKDARVRVINQENQGAAAARNAGMKLAVGEYLSFLDADDFFSPEMLEEMYAGCVEQDADISVIRSKEYNEQSHDHCRCHKQGNACLLTYFHTLFHALFPSCTVPGCPTW